VACHYRDDAQETVELQLPDPKPLRNPFEGASMPYQYPIDTMQVACSSWTMTTNRRGREKKCDYQQNRDGGAPEIDGPGQPGQAGINAARSSGQLIVSHEASCMQL
jgi:hypothetical protein